MRGRNFFFWILLAAIVVLPGCSAVSLYVRHTDPLTPEQHMELGAAYEARGFTEDAGPQYEAAIRLERKYIPAYIARGNLAFAKGDLKKAEAYYKKVLHLERNNAGANNNLAMVYLTRGKNLHKAERYAQAALKQGGPLRPYVLETLASIYIQQSRFSEAREVLDEAAAVAPVDNVPLSEQLAKTREKLLANR